MENNLIRPPLLNVPQIQVQAPPQRQDQDRVNLQQVRPQELEELIRRITCQVLNDEGPGIIRDYMNPAHEFLNKEDEAYVSRADENLGNISDLAKSIRDFSGNPGEFGSWKKSVERLLSFCSPIRGTSRYFSLLMIIRNKITGNADGVLESYNIPLNWEAIHKCLAWHYSDKRDLKTLEQQLSSMTQGRHTIRDFYQTIFSHLSLILDKISCLPENAGSINYLNQWYRDKAKDAFVSGLNFDLPRLLGVAQPRDLPHALHLAESLETQSKFSPHKNNRPQPPQIPPRKFNTAHGNYPTRPTPQMAPTFGYQSTPQFIPQHAPQYPQAPRPFMNYQSQGAVPRNYPFQQSRPPNPQNFVPKSEPMDVDPSLRTGNVDYINRPRPPKPPEKRQSDFPHQVPTKVQRNYHIDNQPCGDDDLGCAEEQLTWEDYQNSMGAADAGMDQTLYEYLDEGSTLAMPPSDDVNVNFLD